MEAQAQAEALQKRHCVGERRGVQREFQWQTTDQTEALTEEPAYARLQWAARTHEKRVGRLMAQCLADAVNAIKQSPGSLGSGWRTASYGRLHRSCCALRLRSRMTQTKDTRSR